MSAINGKFVAILARVWHRFTLANMLAPMDDAGEAVADDIQFDMEPSDFNAALEELAISKDRP